MSKPSVVDSSRILYTPSSFAKASLLHLQEIGELTAIKPHESNRSGLDSFLFFTVLAGSGVLRYLGNSYELEKGSCVFIDCRNAYSHMTSPDDLWTIRWCHFDGPTMPLIYSKYLERGGMPAFVPEQKGAALSIRRLLTELMETAQSVDYMRDMKINEGLSSLITLVMSESWHPEEAPLSQKKSSVLPIKEYLDKHYAEKISLDDLASRFYISKFYLTHVFKEQFGVSVTQYLLNVRITHAKQLLRFSDKSVEEIGLAVGIGPLHYFSRVFKEVEGVSPSVYRRKW